MGYVKGYRDEVIIPDKYNTGVEPGIELISFAQDVIVNGVVLSEDGGNSPVVQYRDDVNYNCINYYQNTNLAKESIIEGYDFSEKRLITTNHNKYTEPKTIIFKNCKFESFAHGTDGLSNLSFIFENCTFGGTVSGSHLTLNHCYIGGYVADGINPYADCIVKNSFISNLTTEANQNGTHIDGVQIFGHEDFESNNIHFDNVRFALPQFYYGGSSTSYTNAAIMLQLERNNANDISFENIMIDMGGHWTPIYNTQPVNFEVTNVLFKNIAITDNYNNIFYSGSYNDDAVVDNVRFESMLYVSSVWKDENNKTHIICTNNSTKSNRTLRVVTSKGNYEFDLKRSPAQKELMEDVTYQTYTFEDMPYDVEYIIEEDVDYVVCYDSSISEENQIRYVSFNSKPNNGSENESGDDGTIKGLFVQICDSIRAKDGSTGLIKHTDIPRRIQNLSSDGGIVPIGSLEITTNGTHDVTSFAQAIVNIPSGSLELPSNVKTGVIQLEANTTEAITINHGCASIPTKVVCLPLDYVADEGTVGGIYIDGLVIGISGSADGTKSSSTGVVAIANINETSFDFAPRSAAYPLIGGHSYFWIAIE